MREPPLDSHLGQVDVIHDRAGEAEIDRRRVLADARDARWLRQGDRLIRRQWPVIDPEVAQAAAQCVVRRHLRAAQVVAVGARRVHAGRHRQVGVAADLDAVLVQDPGPAGPVGVQLLRVGQVLPHALAQRVGHRLLHARAGGRGRRAQPRAEAHGVRAEDRSRVAGRVAVGVLASEAPQMVVAHIGGVDPDVVVDAQLGHARRDVVGQVHVRPRQRIGVGVRVQRDARAGQRCLVRVDQCRVAGRARAAGVGQGGPAGLVELVEVHEAGRQLIRRDRHALLDRDRERLGVRQPSVGEGGRQRGLRIPPADRRTGDHALRRDHARVAGAPRHAGHGGQGDVPRHRAGVAQAHRSHVFGQVARSRVVRQGQRLAGGQLLGVDAEVLDLAPELLPGRGARAADEADRRGDVSGLERQRGRGVHAHAVLVEHHLTRRHGVPALDGHRHVLPGVRGQCHRPPDRLGHRTRARACDRRCVPGRAGTWRRSEIATVVRGPAEREDRPLLRGAGKADVVGDRDVAQAGQQGIRQPDRGSRPAVAARERQAATVVPDRAGIAVHDRRVVAVPGAIVDDGPGRFVERKERHKILGQSDRQVGGFLESEVRRAGLGQFDRKAGLGRDRGRRAQTHRHCGDGSGHAEGPRPRCTRELVDAPEPPRCAGPVHCLSSQLPDAEGSRVALEVGPPDEP